MAQDLFDIQLLRERHSESWDALYRSTCRRTYGVLHHVTGAAEAMLEELNQDVWLSAIDSIDRFDATRGTPQDWVLGIARFKGLTYLRQQYTHRAVVAGGRVDLTEHFAAPADTTDAATEAGERIALLRATIASLPEHWQYILRQKYDEGLSVIEIADLAGLTPKAVESTLSRARQRLRELYRDTVQQRPGS